MPIICKKKARENISDRDNKCTDENIDSLLKKNNDIINLNRY